jgi:hypothetical protein
VKPRNKPKTRPSKPRSKETVLRLFPWLDKFWVEEIWKTQFIRLNVRNIIESTGIPILPTHVKDTGITLIYTERDMSKLKKLMNPVKYKELLSQLNGCTCVAEGWYWNDILNAYAWAMKRKPYLWD